MAEFKRKPRLLVVTSTYPRWLGDTEPAFIHQLASRLTDRFDIVVSTSRAPGAKASEILDGVQVCRYAYALASWETLVYGGGLVGNLRKAKWKVLLLPSYVICWVWQIAKLKRKYGFDVVHAHWFIPGGLVALPVVVGTPLCVTAHGTDVLGLKGALWSWLRRLVSRRAQMITVVGKRVQDILEAEGISSTRLLPMGVDLSKMFVPALHGARSSRLLFVGRLTTAKRPENVLRAFAEVLKIHAGLELDIVGNGPEGSRLEALTEELGITSSVTFHGRKGQSEIATMYRSALAVVIPSGAEDAPEGLGLVAIEALGSGCTVVSVPNVALQELLPEAAPIHYADGSSVGALTEAILDVLAKPNESVYCVWREELARRLDWSQISGKYAQVLESLVTDSLK